MLDDGQQVVRHGGGLRPLRVGVDGEDGVAMAPREVEQNGAEFQAGMEDFQDGFALAHAIHRHVDVVAAAGGVESPGGDLSAAPGDELRYLVEEILAAAIEGCLADCLLRHRIERVANGVGIFRGDDACAASIARCA
ncbi:MAG: hypothetical protein WDO73_15045 [Ignavibacteriota bacterium]